MSDDVSVIEKISSEVEAPKVRSLLVSLLITIGLITGPILSVILFFIDPRSIFSIISYGISLVFLLAIIFNAYIESKH
ncbi:MAG: hypothetical protein INQ03_19325 [Candidatus Heimdallarchaeota archaeon]|nr:hypothetical protein [Candidatus Heimdallarchaeota archaeon]